MPVNSTVFTQAQQQIDDIAKTLRNEVARLEQIDGQTKGSQATLSAIQGSVADFAKQAEALKGQIAESQKAISDNRKQAQKIITDAQAEGEKSAKAIRDGANTDAIEIKEQATRDGYEIMRAAGEKASAFEGRVKVAQGQLAELRSELDTHQKLLKEIQAKLAPLRG